MHIRELTLEEARAVVEAREPRGLFWAREADGYLGIEIGRASCRERVYRLV